eukprot:TRINITY_DN13973_c1_g1_i2.p1 TRINITY_DN13973_c1_g1~~TRINITY_DN13973_c1_g1_i2.p1  ORF type:complete len:501 (+),score=155.65 TRINITY_DN13973_c1_g1_i2:2259-3761(+)
MTWEQLAQEWREGSGATTAEFKAFNYIGGEKVYTEKEIENVAPATGRRIGSIPDSDAQDVEAAVKAAEGALKGPWGSSTVEERSSMLNKIANALERKMVALAALESVDQGKTIGMATNVDIPRAVANFRFFAGAMLHTTDGFHRMAEALNYTTHTRIGVVGLITPWNLPLYLLSWKVAPALAMGNVIVAKPSEMTPFTATVLAEVCAEAGLPTGVFNLVHGYGHRCGAAIVSHPKIKAISFTGGTVTGERVAATAAPMFKKLSLELGGKNPTVVFADADFDTAVAGAAAAGFTNQGEICLCGSRLLVERSIHDKFVAALVEKVKAHVVGDPRSTTSTMGALVSKAHREKVEGYIKMAVDMGGKVVCGGVRPSLPAPFTNGAFLEPTVITGLAHDARPAVQEIFGPVVTVHPFDTPQEAIAIANETPYGLAGSVWTTNLNLGHQVAGALDTGMVWVNCWLLRDLRVPFGGVKASGVGREGGRLSLDFFSESKNICVKVSKL